MTVFTNRQLPVRQLIYIIVIQALFGEYAAAADIYRYGTIIADYRSNDFAVVASDGLVTYGNGKPAGQQCKIHKLDGHSFFASSGLTIITGAHPGETEFSADDEARHAYTASGDLRQISDTWASSVEADYYALKDQNWNAIADAQSERKYDHIVTGIFGRIRGDGSPEVADVTVKFTRTPFGIRFHHSPPDTLNRNETNLFGTSAVLIAQEYLSGTTMRAKLWQERFKEDNSDAAVGASELEAKYLHRLIKTMIDKDVDPLIGGTVSVAIIEKDRNFRWAFESDACKAN